MLTKLCAVPVMFLFFSSIASNAMTEVDSASKSISLCTSSTPAGKMVSKKGEQPGTDKSFCQASCHLGPSVSINCSGQCIAVDRSCSDGRRGYVQCGTTQIFCAAPCEDCSANGWCNANCGSSDPDCNPCTQLPNYSTCQYQWEPGISCCEPIPGIGCPEYCI